MIRASNILAAAQKLLIDESAIRWSLTELASWLNEGLHQLADDVPTATATAVVFSLVEGANQRLPESIGVLIAPISNVSLDTEGNIADYGSRVTPTTSNQLDVCDPMWRNKRSNRPYTAVRHVIQDEGSPRNFWVYPPNDGTGAILMNASNRFQFTATSENMADYEGQTIAVIPDEFESALTNYVLYRAYTKDSQTAGAINLAINFKNLYSERAGIAIPTNQGQA